MIEIDRRAYTRLLSGGGAVVASGAGGVTRAMCAAALCQSAEEDDDDDDAQLAAQKRKLTHDDWGDFLEVIHNFGIELRNSNWDARARARVGAEERARPTARRRRTTVAGARGGGSEEGSLRADTRKGLLGPRPAARSERHLVVARSREGGVGGRARRTGLATRAGVFCLVWFVCLTSDGAARSCFLLGRRGPGLLRRAARELRNRDLRESVASSRFDRSRRACVRVLAVDDPRAAATQ